MRLVKFSVDGHPPQVGCVEGNTVWALSSDALQLSDLLHSQAPLELARKCRDSTTVSHALDKVALHAPIDNQEIWAAGVTYKRSQVARMEESETGASHYDRVYTADRPELFLKATPHRVAGPGESIRIRNDSEWSVPEPELAVVIDPTLRIVGYTIGNDVSARDIEGQNPLYLPQAKVYSKCCAVGPCVLLSDEPLDLHSTCIQLVIERRGESVFQADTQLEQLNRSIEDLVSWLGRENEFPTGVLLLTGTGIVPPDDFALAAGDVVSISITGIGTLVNSVAQGN